MGITVESAPVQQKPKRGPIVPIPADAPKMPQLDAHRKECGALSEGIKKLIDQIKESREKSNNTERDAERKALLDQRSDLIQKKRDATKEITVLREQLKKTFDAVKLARQQVRDGERNVRQTARDQALLDPKEIDRQIKELEFKIESGGVSSIKGEKKVMQQIKELNAAKSRAKDTAALIDATLTSAEGARDKAADAAEVASLLQEKMDLQRAKVQSLLTQIEDKSTEIDLHSQNSEAQKMREQRDAWGVEIDSKRATLDALNKGFDEKKKKFQEWKVGYDKLCDLERERRRKERDEEDKKRDAERKEKELLMQSIRRMNPYEQEINSAETLIGYLKGKIAFSAKEVKPAPEKVHFDAAAAVAKLGGDKGKQFAVIGKKDKKGGDDMFSGFGKKKKNDAPQKAGKPAPAKKVEEEKEVKVARKPLKHSSEKFAAFEKVGVRMPQFTDEVKEAIDPLKAKKAEWESHKKTEKEAMAEEQAERIAQRAKNAAEEAADEE